VLGFPTGFSNICERFKKMENKIKVVLYARVSTKEQTTENQILELRDFCKRNNYEIFKEYRDDGVSGKLISRPALDEMLQDMREKKFNMVVVYKFDRLGRSTKHLLQVYEEMKNKGVRLVATSQNIDTSSSMGKFFFTILSGIAELEREMLIDRVKSGVSRAKSEGKHCGRPKGSKDKGRRKRSGYWLRWSKKKELVNV